MEHSKLPKLSKKADKLPADPICRSCATSQVWWLKYLLGMGVAAGLVWAVAIAIVVCSYLNHSDVVESIAGDDVEENQDEKPVNIIQQITHAIQNIFVNVGFSILICVMWVLMAVVEDCCDRTKVLLDKGRQMLDRAGQALNSMRQVPGNIRLILHKFRRICMRYVSS
eukprot:TRINITY_DN5112_c0_g1_i2.p1 TRINITY_DN5112_c0_g1~~TRINITY_DN5112_c0_g1_i2.p1  ORF type:complete len:168 (-),score=50.97 TRINITY_DN5112_c0_g1_i2:107-610(-)